MLILQAVPIFATDSDIGINADIIYQIVGPESNQFVIDSKTGLIKTKTLPIPSLDYESKIKYSFFINAVDKDGLGLQSSANMTINILDENDNPPVFQFSYYSTAVPESTVIGYDVLQLNATDPDSEIFGVISYCIISGSAGKFKIDRNSGIIRTAGNLDREAKDLYILNISGIDGGLNPNSAYCTVAIRIIDINDNVPVFTESGYEASVIESAPVGSTVILIKAVDPDQGVAGTVTYTMSSDTFGIDKFTGSVDTTQLLDRERISLYYLTITTSDGGGFSANVTLIVRIQDANDNIPVFLSPNILMVDLFEKTPNGSIVAIVMATDKDLGANGSVEYFLDINGANLFRIDNSTGIVRLVYTL